MTRRRISISKKIRFEVFKRDGFVCQYCGTHPPDVILEIDHIIPVKEGGGSDEANLLTACFDCNRGKAGNSLSSIPKSLAEKAAEIREREEQIAGYRQIMLERTQRIWDDQWTVAEALEPGCSKPEAGFRRDWLGSIKKFNDSLPLDVVIDAAETAYTRYPNSISRRFYYFCGICWNRIRPERMIERLADPLCAYCQPQMIGSQPNDAEA